MEQKETAESQVAGIILNAVKNLKVGRLKLAGFLKGSKSKVVAPVSDFPIYGGLFWYTIPVILQFIEQLENHGLLQRKFLPMHSFSNSYLELTESGMKALEERQQISLQVIKEIKPVRVGDSEHETYGLLKQGKSPHEIAAQRNLALSTIYTHCYRLIVTGNLSVLDVIAEQVVGKVKATARTLSEPTVAKVKELLPEISYEEIRCTLAGMKARNYPESVQKGA